MGDFVRALEEAERDVLAQSDVEAARQRVARRLRVPKPTPPLERARIPMLVFTACVLSVGLGFWLAGRLAPTPSPVAVRGEELPPSVPPPARALPGAVTARETGRLAVQVVDGACELEIANVVHAEASTLDVAMPVGRYDVVCRRGLSAQHERLEIREGKTTRVTFRFAANTVDAPAFPDLDDDEDDEPPPPAVEDDVVSGPRGTLVAIAIGGSCDFTVDGKPKGKRSSLRFKVAVGVHVVTCDAGGRHGRQSVMVATDHPGIASFKLPLAAARPAPRIDPPPREAAPPKPPAPDLLDPWERR